MTHGFTRIFTAAPDDIDELGHVNNSVWVQWIQTLATEHWHAVARAEDQAAFHWVVVRHEIDYRGNITVRDTARGNTWIEGRARGATSVRRVDFHDSDGQLVVSARTRWAMLDTASGRPARVRPEILAPFVDVD